MLEKTHGAADRCIGAPAAGVGIQVLE